MSETSDHYREIEQKIGKATSNRTGRIIMKSLTLAVSRHYGIEEHLPFKFADISQEITKDGFMFWYAAFVTYSRADIGETPSKIKGGEAIIDQFAGRALACCMYRNF